MWNTWLRAVEPLEQVLRRHGVLATVAVVEVLVLVLALLPFALFYSFAPATFDEDLQLGAVPTLAAGELPEDEDGERLGAPPRVGLPPSGIDRIAPEVATDLGPNVRVTLVFSVGSRALTDDDAERLRVNDLDERGDDGLTDVVMLVIADPDSGRVSLLSLPRDYFLRSKDDRINTTWTRSGTQGLVDDVGLVTGLPIHHVALVNFNAFAQLVDELNGVAMRVDRVLADLNSVLWIPGPGCWRFDGAAALAYVRSRNTLTRTEGGRYVVDESASDFGRIARQQQLLGAAFDQLRGTRAVARVPDLLGVARDGLVVDRGLGPQQVRLLLQAFRDVTAGSFEGYTIPTRAARIDGKAVLVPDAEPATEVMQRLRTWPPSADLPAPTETPTPTETQVPVDETCTLADARPLPEPRAPLAEVAARRPRPRPSATPRPADDSPTVTPTATDTDTPTPDPGPTSTEPTPTAPASPTPRPSGSASPTPTQSPSAPPPASPSPTGSPSGTPEPTPSSPSPTPTRSPSPSPTPTPTPSPTPSPSPTSSPTPSTSPSPSESASDCSVIFGCD